MTAVAIVAGATGLVGRELVRLLAADSAWREVRALARQPLPSDRSSANVVPIQVDYDRLDPLADWAAADHVFCALGTTMRQAGSEAAFRRVDLDYPLALGRAALARGARHFLLVSALGASPTSRVFYNRVKGEVEAAIASLGFQSVTIARPSLLLGERAEPRSVEQVWKALGALTPARWKPVPATAVALAIIDAAKHDVRGIRILENRELRSTAG